MLFYSTIAFFFQQVHMLTTGNTKQLAFSWVGAVMPQFVVDLFVVFLHTFSESMMEDGVGTVILVVFVADVMFPFVGGNGAF